MEKILQKLEQLKRKHNISYWILLVKTTKLFSSKLKKEIENTPDIFISSIDDEII